jgi:hypothetical protein
MMVAQVRPGPILTIDSPQPLFEGPFFAPSSMRGNRTYDVSADGTRFLMINEPTKTDSASHFVVVLNWLNELKRLAPAQQIHRQARLADRLFELPTKPGRSFSAADYEPSLINSLYLPAQDL